jgi:GH15 family glucan-1,4-alpha-glucosidase
MDSLYVAHRQGFAHNDDSWPVQKALMEFLESAWDEPNNGIWEVRGPGAISRIQR